MNNNYLVGKFHLTASGHNSYEIIDAGVEALKPIAKILGEEFLYKPNTSLIQGLDGNYIDFMKDKIRLTLGWDIWSVI
ncbi:hypothetical protein MO973_01860 [Paenibacillus sp. TRM 82003]|nr:hypothetical protein [Paenibacillus sp. TRM 82003]